MKPVRFFVVLLTVGMLVTALTPVMPLSNNTVHTNITTFNVPGQGFNNLALDLSANSPLAFMASAPAVTLVLESSSSARDYSCSLVSQSPTNWTKMSKRQDFDAKWTLKNIGARNWGIHGIDVKFISSTGGKTMHTSSRTLFDLPQETGPGKKITIRVDMNAPNAKGYYSEQWGLFTGNISFCRFSITINVTH